MAMNVVYSVAEGAVDAVVDDVSQPTGRRREAGRKAKPRS